MFDSAPVETEPDVAPPVEKPVPVQLVALVEDHVRAEEAPETTLEGLALSEAVGVGVCFLSSHPYPYDGNPMHIMESYMEFCSL